MDWGCLAFLIAGFVGVFFVVPIVYFFSAFTIIPLLVLGLIGFLTIFVNPVEKRENKVKWTGRIITFVILTLSKILLSQLKKSEGAKS